MNQSTQPNPEIDERAKQLLHNAGYAVEGFPPPKPRGVLGHAAVYLRYLIAVAVASAIGLVTNLISFFTLAFAFADDLSGWAHWYFGNDGWYFMTFTTVIALAVFPKIKRLKFF